MKKYVSLVVNPGSTSTKIGVFEDLTLSFEKTIRHSPAELEPFADILDQLDFRTRTIREALSEAEFDLSALDFIMARGGVLNPMPSGTYCVNDRMLADLRTSTTRHASNIAAFIADALSKDIGGIPCFIADPVVVDEMEDVARVSGNKNFVRKSFFHALNQKATARKYASDIERPYEQLNLIVAHMGGGVSVAAHKGGRVVDVNQTIDGEGPFSPERSGTLPVGDLVRMCFSGKYSEREMIAMINGRGGVLSYLGVSDMRDVVKMMEDGNRQAELVLDAMTYQIAKEIGGLSTVFYGKVDAILLTGGIAYNPTVMGRLIPRIEYIAPVKLYPGEDELGSLVAAGMAAISGRRPAQDYPPAN